MNSYTFIPLIVVTVVIVIPAVIGIIWWINKSRKKARSFGYSTWGEYLRAPPKTDEEKQDTVDLTLLGLVLCLLGFAIPPLLLIGVFPLFFGARKMAYSSLGLGLVDDADL